MFHKMLYKRYQKTDGTVLDVDFGALTFSNLMTHLPPFLRAGSSQAGATPEVVFSGCGEIGVLKSNDYDKSVDIS